MGKVRMENTGFESSVNPAEKEPWPKVRLGDVCEVRAGGDYKDVLSKTGKYPIYGTGGIMGRATEYRCPANSVIVGRKGTLDNPLLIEEPFWNIDTCFGVIPSCRILPKYLHLFCLNFDFYSLCPAIGRPSTTSTAIKNIEIPLPPLPVQHSIVARLEKELGAVDRMAKGFEKMAEEADATFKAELKETFEEVARGGIETRRLGDVCVFTTSGSRGWAKYQSKSGEYFITIKNVRGGRISLDNISFVHAPNDKEAIRTKVQTGDLLVSITADLGRTGVVTKNIAEHGAYINQHLICLRLNKEIDPYFVAYFVESPLGHKQIYGKNKDAVKAGLNFDSVKSVTIPYLSFPIQRKIVAKLDAVRAWCDKIKRAAEEGVKTTTRLRKAILKEAFE